MNIPIKHLSVRVPWHDLGWNGKVCCKPRENGSCMYLPRINQSKNVEYEETIKEKWLHEIEDKKLLPPCVAEKVHFMSPHTIHRPIFHPYSKNENNDEYYKHYKETTYSYPGYSFSVVPYNWMFKNPENSTSEKAKELNLKYSPEKEPDLDFENIWVQQLDNQRALLDAFISPIKPSSSLVFIYAKNVPFIESTSRVLIGVGHISQVGSLTEYEYDDKLPTTFRSTLWERPIYHTIREGFENGFLLPYQELFKLIENDTSINASEYIAIAPSFEEFSFGSEWVSNDTAIESLLILYDKLKKLETVLTGKNYEKQLKWIDNEISRIWKMRGPFPGLGAVLSGLKISNGNLVAWEIDKLIRGANGEVVKNPWEFVESMFKNPNDFLKGVIKVSISDTEKGTWEKLSIEEKAFLELLSRMNLTNEQVNLVIDSKKREQVEYIKNPYLLYEKFRLKVKNFPVSVIDKAIFAEAKILEKFPLNERTNISASLDQRRIRALSVEILEAEIPDGNTLLTDSQLITKLDKYPIQPLCNPSLRNMAAIEDFLKEEVLRIQLDGGNEEFYFKLKRFEEIKDVIKKFVQKRIQRPIEPPIKQDWEDLVNKDFGPIDKEKPKWYQEKEKQARKEKAASLNILSNSRFSVLIGPAGTGKTKLLNLLCSQSYISSGSILKLAPTGKARVNMAKDAQTLGQFLIHLNRYEPDTGRYKINPDAKTAQYNTVIVDEASMITEEQLAALLDSLTGVERLILVGDNRQLPPIGSGRPFGDIINYLTNEKKCVAELKVLFRQLTKQNTPETEKERLDVRLSKWFSDDEIKKQELDIFKEIGEHKTKEWNNIRFIEWHNVKHLEEILIDVINSEIERLLSLTPGKVLRNPQANFDSALGSNFYFEDSNWSGFGIESANEIENWQIISPMKTLGYGTKVLNQRIQKVFRGKTKEKAIFPGKYLDYKTKKERFAPRKMPKPVGDDSIVFGDKVINTRNTRWNQPWNYVFNPNGLEDEEILRYFANGEIGLHIGAYGNWNKEQKGYKRPIYISFSSQPGYAYSFREADFREDGENIEMELAYSITVHKSQGSGFNTVLFVLPNPCPVLSRELFYTALTRQEDRIVILHQGDFKDFKKYTRGEFSETGRRLTDLFVTPALKIVKSKIYDSNYIQVSAQEEFMISKSEVIIADQLYYNKIKYAYEAPITDEHGITIHPDFTIEDSNSGIVYYWEHLGLLIDDDYRSTWKLKQEWYKRNNIVDYKTSPSANKQLILTRDKPDGGIDSSEIKNIIQTVLK